MQIAVAGKRHRNIHFVIHNLQSAAHAILAVRTQSV